MGKYRVEVKKTALKELQKIKVSGRKADLIKLERIFDELSENPYEGTGEPEKLKHNLSGYWSRKINKKDRLIYEVKEEIVTVFVLSALGHYSDH